MFSLWYIQGEEYHDTNTDSDLEPLRSWISDSIQTNDPARLCKVLILPAGCIQQFLPGQQVGRLLLRTSLEPLEQQYIKTANAFLALDNGILGTVDRLQCLLSQVTFYLHAGLPRKAWVLIRRATAFAQLLPPSSITHDAKMAESGCNCGRLTRACRCCLVCHTYLRHPIFLWIRVVCLHRHCSPLNSEQSEHE